MATEITCIVPDGSDPDRRIDAVGGDGWQKDEDTVIGEIEDGAEYYVEVDRRVGVEIGTYEGRKYLKTENDGYPPNNLLSLPAC